MSRFEPSLTAMLLRIAGLLLMAMTPVVFFVKMGADASPILSGVCFAAGLQLWVTSKILECAEECAFWLRTQANRKPQVSPEDFLKYGPQ